MNAKAFRILPDKVIIITIILHILVFITVTQSHMVLMAEAGFHVRLTPYPVIFKLPLSESMSDCVFNLAQETFTTYLIFLPKLHILTLIMREQQTKPNLRDILKNNWPKFFKAVNVVKNQRKARKPFQMCDSALGPGPERKRCSKTHTRTHTHAHPHAHTRWEQLAKWKICT